MEITKYKSGEILFQIRHDMRELPDEKIPSNEAINPELTKNNYSLIDRGKTAKEINDYRKQIEKEIFSYKRKDVVHDIEYVFQYPVDCPPEQKGAFFQACYDYTVSTLPMGERCVFIAEVHTDEKHKVTSPDGVEMMVSKDHLHMHVIPAVPDTKHEGYKFRLCADQLTKRSQLKSFHPGLQKYLDDHGIHATVYKKKSGDGKTISLSVKQLKEISAQTGIVFDHTLTTDELSEILKTNILKDKQIQALQVQLSEKDKTINTLSVDKEKEISNLKEQLSEKNKTIVETQQKSLDSSRFQQELHEKESEITDLKSQLSLLSERIKSLENEAVDKDSEITKLKESSTSFDQIKDGLEEKINGLEKELSDKDKEISELKVQVSEHAVDVEKKSSVWGRGVDNSVEWGSGDDSWGNSNKTIDKDITW